MKLFHLYRAEDFTGVSGTGPVVEGVQFSNGWCVIRWMSDRSTLGYYASLDDVKHIHGHGGRTELVVHDFQSLPFERPAARLGANEVFLSAIEMISEAVNLAEEPGASLAEIHSSIEEAKRLLDELEGKLARRKRAA